MVSSTNTFLYVSHFNQTYKRKKFLSKQCGKKIKKINRINEEFIDVSFYWLWEIKKRSRQLNSGIGVSDRTAKTSNNVGETYGVQSGKSVRISLKLQKICKENRKISHYLDLDTSISTVFDGVST